MEELNKKTLLHIFLGFVFIQGFILLAISANFLLAQTYSTPKTSIPNFTINIISPDLNESEISRTLNFHIISNSPDGQLLNGLGLYFDDPDTTNNPADYGLTAESSDFIHWSVAVDTTIMKNKNYKVYAKGFYGEFNFDNTPFFSDELQINVNNLPSTITEITEPTIVSSPLQISSFEIPTEITSGTIKIYVHLNKYIEKYYIKFYVTGGPNHINIVRNSYHEGNIDGYEKYYFNFDTALLNNGTYMIKVEASDNTETVFQEKTIVIDNIAVKTDSSTTIDPLRITSFEVPTTILSGNQNIWTVLNQKATVNFYVTGNGINKSYNNIYSEPYNGYEKYYFNFDTALLNNGTYTIKIKANNDTEIIFQERTIIIDNNITNAEPVEPTTTETIEHTMTSDPLQISSFEIPTGTVGGAQRIYIKLNNQIPKENIQFYLTGGPNNINERVPSYHSNDFYGSEYYTDFDTTRFPNGAYAIKVEVKAKTELKIETRTINIFNEKRVDEDNTYINNNDNLYISECEEKGFTTKENCDEYMKIDYECRKNNILNFEDCSNYLRTIYLPQECIDQGITAFEKCNEIMYTSSAPDECQENGITTKEECHNIMSINYFITPECKNENITTPEACDEFMMKYHMPYECQEKGAATKEECDYILRDLYHNFEDISNIANPKIMSDLIFIGDKLPFECEDRGIASFDECENYIISISMPKECQDAGIKTKEECEKVMFENYAPQECIDKGISSPEECEKFMFKLSAPDDCKNAGILNPEACKKFMFEKYSGGENIPADKFPYECKEANAKNIEECEKIMMKQYMPKECQVQNFDNEKDCETYLQKKYMPKECQDAGATTRKECDKIMFKKFGPPECKIAGIENEIECEEFMFNKYAPKVKCEGIEDWQCKNFIKERHLGNIVAKQAKYNKIIEKKNEIIGRSMEVEDLETKIIQEEIVPIVRKNIGIKIITTSENIVLNEEESLIQTAPIAFMIDSDKDGLPDNMEKRFGTDPYKTDTDEDGHNDKEEIENGYNPLGEGKLEKKITPIEKAILEDKPLGHPTIEGEETENFFVKNIRNAEDAEGNLIEGYILSGKTKPNSVATLYIYSDLPIVVTVDADQYGNWQYQFDQSLVDGEHEIYVAINDDTGKVIEKSKPLSFFIEEAKAVSAKDFVSITKASSPESKESETSIYYYLLITLFMAIAGILLFLVMVINRRKNQSLQ